jgi:hypothetical protein
MVLFLLGNSYFSIGRHILHCKLLLPGNILTASLGRFRRRWLIVAPVCFHRGINVRDATTHVIFEPVDFIARLAALVPKPRVNLTRYQGVFAPNSNLRARVTGLKWAATGRQAQKYSSTSGTIRQIFVATRA